MRIGAITTNTNFVVDSSIYNRIPNSGNVNTQQADATVIPDTESAENTASNTTEKKPWSTGTKILVATTITIFVSGVVYAIATPNKKSKKRKK